MIRRIAVIALLALCLAATASAHQRSLSYSSWRPDADGARVDARVSQLDLSRIGLAFQGSGEASDPIAAYILSRLALFAGDAVCRPTDAPTRRDSEDGWAVYAWRVNCETSGLRRIESQLFFDVAPSHLHFARVETAGGGGTERVLSEAAPSWSLPDGSAGAEPTAANAGTNLAGYVQLGIEHILSGWDHLAFVLALLLLAATLGEVAALVTAFTLAHSVTLGLATLGWVQPQAGAVEALIGFSIALVAAENSWILSGRKLAIPLATVLGLLALAMFPDGAVVRVALLGLALFSTCHFGLLQRAERPARLRAAVAFAFGLVHGFGFAGILAALELPTARLVPALFGFNIGVEIGQLAVVAIAWPTLRAIAKRGDGRAGRLVAEFGSAAVCGLGVYWFVVRQFG